MRPKMRVEETMEAVHLQESIDSTMPRRSLIRSLVSAELRPTVSSNDESRRVAKLLLCLTEIGVRTGGLSTPELVSDLLFRLEAALLRRPLSVQGYLLLLRVDTEKYLIRHLNDMTEGDPHEALRSVLTSAAAVEQRVESLAESLLSEISSVEQNGP
ncbi:hypothetical protein CAZ10_10125 [Pseudomonas aeruginosa]|uniref:Uncharacterized protein n=1 Tax=Pseudomonas aeruginosa TaxID=287 RepID=A0A241XRQ3_PSEAI|nr:hypothetical protein CAZ10_10125 [Pseudomonas aeruginosa]